MKVRIPGKQIILGEYAVLEPYQRGIVMAINRFLTIRISHCECHQIISDEFSEIIHWTIDQGKVSLLYGTKIEIKKTEFLKQALEIATTYLEEKGISLPFCKIEITSELKDPISGLKYGLGSSAAFIVGIIKALIKFSMLEKLADTTINSDAQNNREVEKLVSDDLIFHLAVIAHYKAQGNGSGIDVAASVYGGVLLFESLDREWILNKLSQEARLTDVVELSWPCGQVEKVLLPNDLAYLVGWTGNKAETKDFASAYMKSKEDHYKEFSEFKTRTNEIIDLFISACKNKDIDRILQAINQQRLNLGIIEKVLGLEIETPKLAQLCTDFGEIGQAKLSGAGGGDCGIGFYHVKNKANLPSVLDKWRKDGILAIIQ